MFVAVEGIFIQISTSPKAVLNHFPQLFRKIIPKIIKKLHEKNFFLHFDIKMKPVNIFFFLVQHMLKKYHYKIKITL